MPQTVAAGLVFPECPRWHGDALWFSDQHDRRVLRLEPSSGSVSTMAVVPGQPSGLGWLPGGDLLVVSMTDRRLLRRRSSDGSIEEYADLSAVAAFHCNDLVVDARGRAYVGNFGFDFEHGGTFSPAVIALVDVDRQVRVAASELAFPNGMVITPDGSRLVVGETMNGRLTEFDIADDATLRDRRTFAHVDRTVPDGICLDAEEAVWFADPVGGDVVRVRRGGEVTDRVSPGEGLKAYACMLGGPDRRTLYICAAPSHLHTETVPARAGQVLAVDVAVPGAGLP